MLETAFAAVGTVAIACVMAVYIAKARSLIGLWPICLLLPVTQLALAWLLFGLSLASDLPSWIAGAGCALCILSLVVDLLLVRVLRSMSDNARMRVEADLLESQLQAQVEHKARLEREMRDVREMRDGMMWELRDLKDAIDERAGGVAFERELSNACEAMAEKRGFCQNRIVDALMMSKKAICDESGIDLSARLDIPSRISLSSVELCAVFSNMMDNAINGCLEEGCREKWIDLDAAYGKGFLIIEMENACAPFAASDKAIGAGASIKESSGREPMDAPPRHGWGQGILRMIAKNHNGSFSAACDAGAEDGIRAAYRTKMVLEL